MDETCFSNGIVSNTTIHKQGANSDCLKTTGHEKFMVRVCLAAKADRNQVKNICYFPCSQKKSKS